MTLESYSIIPGNDLAYNTGEMLDITFDNVRDTVRGGYVVRVREIYAAETTRTWKVKTTTGFIPSTNNEPIPILSTRLFIINMRRGLTMPGIMGTPMVHCGC